MPHRLLAVRLYVAVVCLLGLGAVPVLLVRSGLDATVAQRPTFLVLAVGCVLGELFPIAFWRGHEEGAVTVSTTFAFALLLLVDLNAAMLGLGGAAVVAGLVQRTALWKTAFNLGQYTLSLVATAAVLRVLTDLPHPTGSQLLAHDLPGLVGAAVAFFVVNDGLAGVGQALAAKANLWRFLAEDLRFQATTAAVLLSLSPVVVVVAERSLWLLVLVVVPLIAVYAGARVSLAHEHQALHDVLTDLPNRALLRDRTGQAVRAARRSGGRVGVMVLDLDRFREINDTLGHGVGDQLLQQVATRLHEPLRESDTVARLGGDEFAVLLPEVDATVSAEQVAHRVAQALVRPFEVGPTLDLVEASIGVALYPDHGEDVDELLQRADVAMYVAKAARTGVETYSPERDRHDPARLILLGELRRALQADELVLHYQPKVDLQTGRVDGVEALVRWQHPKHGLLPPGAFLPDAEPTGLSKPVTVHVLERALQQCSAWARMGFDLRMAVNVSTRHLLDASFPDDVARLLGEQGVIADHLALEITESTMMEDPERALGILSRLHAMGVRLSIDDFGTGFSSLAYLKRLPVEELKIDRSFVQNMATDDSDEVIVRSTIDLARDLGLWVVAEGVETEGVLLQLADLGCNAAQGFWLSRPVPAAELTKWLRAQPDKRSAVLGGRAPG